MKTIEIKSGDQTVQFTTKSVTMDGKEYFYSDITELYHSAIVHTYQFECYGEVKRLTYEKKDAKILNAIFSQVKNLEVKRQAQPEAAPAKEPTPAPAEAPVETPVKEASAEEPEAEKAEAPAEEPEAEKTEAPAEEPEAEKAEASVDAKKPAADTLEDMINATIALNEERAKKEAAKEAKKARRKAIREAKKNGTPIPEEYLKDEAEKKESITADPEKMERLKRSLKIFGIIIAAVIVASVIYYFVFGTANDPTDTNPSNIESQQYDDIDQLIDDMQ